MELLRKIEDAGIELFVRRMPFQVRPATRLRLAGMLWALALLAGLGRLLTAFWLWRAGQRASELADTANYLSRLYGDSTVVDHPGIFFYITIILIIADAVLLLWAVPALRACRKDRGWNYAFYALLLWLFTGLLRVFSDVDGGVGNLLLAIVAAGIGGYILFQVRDYFNGTHTVASGEKVKKAPGSEVPLPSKNAGKKQR